MKTPEQYAKELLDKYLDIESAINGGCFLVMEEVKQIALIDIQNTIDTLEKLKENSHTSDFWVIELTILNYIEAKQIIENS